MLAALLAVADGLTMGPPVRHAAAARTVSLRPLCSLAALERAGVEGDVIRTGLVRDPVRGCIVSSVGIVCDPDDEPPQPESPARSEAPGRPEPVLHFASLATPAAFEARLAEAASDGSLSLVKFGAPYCRSCRALDVPGSKLDAIVAERYPSAELFALELVRNGKAAGERMFKHYKAHGVKSLPHVEVYRGSELIETIPSSALL